MDWNAFAKLSVEFTKFQAETRGAAFRTLSTSFVVTSNEAFAETVGRRASLNLSRLRRQICDSTLEGAVMLALGDDLVDRACSRFVHERLIRQAVARTPDGIATERVTLATTPNRFWANSLQKRVGWTSLWSLSWAILA
jgi:hypothetical protein